ncbi:MAG: hypothetical protein ACXVRP_04325, partial [Solirubrobacteraceae bacterium]
DGCQDGLTYGDPPVRWTSPRSFRTRMIVPAAPWIEGGPARVAPLVSGPGGTTPITPVTVIAGGLWWLTGPADDPDAAPTVNRLALSALAC